MQVLGLLSQAIEGNVEGEGEREKKKQRKNILR
jgi:hypothetical protein